MDENRRDPEQERKLEAVKAYLRRLRENSDRLPDVAFVDYVDGKRGRKVRAVTETTTRH